MRILRLILLPILFLSHPALGLVSDFQKDIYSPEKKVKVSFQFKNGKLNYAVFYNGKTVIENGKLGILTTEDNLSVFKDVKISERQFDNFWKPVWGQSSEIKEAYTELRIDLTANSNNRKLIVFLRAHDDGFAFKYEIPKQKRLNKIAILSEESTFAFVGKYKCWWNWADYNTLEKSYFNTSLDSAKHVATPFTLEGENGIFVSVHESAILDYSTMTLLQDSIHRNSFNVNLVPWADGILVKAEKTVSSPWRAFIFGANAGDLIESNLILNLNESCKIKDVSWIQPMLYFGIWWEMHLGISTWKEGEKHGATTENAKKYIDFASENGIKGVLIEGWNTGWENWGKKDAFDFTSDASDFNLKEVVSYAKSKGVEIIGHHETGGDTESYEKRVKKAFKMYHKLGIRIVKTGYAGPVTPVGENHHGQRMVQHYNRIMKLAAKYELMLDVHEPIVFSGLSRTYPNLMTAEGVRGMEWNAWSEGNSPSHTCILPFTRGIAGPIDYTAGIFDIDLSNFASERVKWNGLDNGKTTVHSTLSNQLALLVILYSPLQMAADLPENYKNHPAFKCIQKLPTTWDETLVLDAKIGEYVVIARRDSLTWFIAAITNEIGRDLEITFPNLNENLQYTSSYFLDGEDAHFEENPESYLIEEKIHETTLKKWIKLAPGGGSVIILEPIN
jgi:alpha-glucosidase